MARELELRVFELTKKFPKDEFFRSVDQVRRSSSSITNNIAEGYNKRSIKDRVRIFNDIAKGEANETRGNLEITLKKGFHNDQILIDDYTQLIKGISGFVNFLKLSESPSKLTNLQTFKLDRVLAIDPGFDRIGVAVIENNKLLFSCCIETNRKLSHAKRLIEIGEGVREIIDKWRPKALAIEQLFFNQNITNALKVSEARGVIIYEATKAGLEIFEYSPQAVKIAVTGYGQADKTQVETMVRKLIKIDDFEKKLDDEIDAIALCITHLATIKGI